MTIENEQLERVSGFLHAQVDAFRKTNRIIEILLGDICTVPPATVKEFLVRVGVTAEEFDAMTAEQRLAKIMTSLKSSPTHTDNLIAALDVIFEARYGWPEGTARTMPIEHVFSALEHATEYDCPWMPSIWEMTK